MPAPKPEYLTALRSGFLSAEEYAALTGEAAPAVDLPVDVGPEGVIPQAHVRGPLPITPTDVKDTQADVIARSYEAARRSAPVGETYDATTDRAQADAEDIIGSEPPPNPNMGLVEGVQRAWYGDMYPVVDKLPASEQALYAIDTLLPGPFGRPLEALRTGDVSGAAKRAVYDIAPQSPSELITTPTRIGDDVVPQESDTMRLLRVVGGGVQAGMTAAAHEVLRRTTPEDVVNTVGEVAAGTVPGGASLGGLVSPVFAVAGLPSPAQMVLQDRAVVKGAVDALYAIPRVVEKASPIKVMDEATGEERAKVDMGEVAARLLSDNMGKPLIGGEAEREERGEDRWHVSGIMGTDGWMPAAVGDPLGVYLQEVSRGRGGREIGAELALTAGYEKGSDEYGALATAGLLSDFLPYDDIPFSAIGKAFDVSRAVRAGQRLDAVAGAGTYAATLEAALREAGNKGGAVDAVRPAVLALRQELAAGRGAEAWDRLVKAEPDLAVLIDRIHHQRTGETMAQTIAKETPPTPGAPESAENPPSPAGPPKPEALSASSDSTGEVDDYFGRVAGTPTPTRTGRVVPEQVDRIPANLPTPNRPEDMPAQLPHYRDVIAQAEQADVKLQQYDQQFARWWADKSATLRQAFDRLDQADAEFARKWRERTTPPLPRPQVVEVEWDPTTDHPIDGPLYRTAVNQDAKWAAVEYETDPRIAAVEYETDTPTMASLEEIKAETGPMRVYEEEAPRWLPDTPPPPTPGQALVNTVLASVDEVHPEDVLTRHDFDLTHVLPAEERDAMAWAARQKAEAGAVPSKGALEDVTAEVPNERTEVPLYEKGGRPRVEKQTGEQFFAGNERYLRAGARLPFGGMLDDLRKVQSLPKFTPEIEKATEDYLKHPGLIPHMMDKAPLEAQATADAMRIGSSGAQNGDMASAMRAFADVLDPNASTAAKIRAMHEFAVFTGQPVVGFDASVLVDAVRDGKVSQARAAKAVMAQGTAAGREALTFWDQFSRPVGSFMQAPAPDAQRLYEIGKLSDPNYRVVDELSAHIARAYDSFKQRRVAMAETLNKAKARLATMPRVNTVMGRDPRLLMLPPEELVAILWDQARGHVHQSWRQGGSDRGRALTYMEEQVRSVRQAREPKVPAPEAKLSQEIAAEQPKAPPAPRSPQAVLGFHSSGQPGAGGSRPLNPRQAILDAGYTGTQREWNEAEARKDAYGGHSGAYDLPSRMLEEKPDIDGNKYKMVRADGAPGKPRRTRINEAGEEVPAKELFTLTGGKMVKGKNGEYALRFDADDAVSNAISKSDGYRAEGVTIKVHGSERPIAVWKYDAHEDVVKLVPHYGASPEEAQVIRRANARFSPEEMKARRAAQRAASGTESVADLVARKGREFLSDEQGATAVEKGIIAANPPAAVGIAAAMHIRDEAVRLTKHPDWVPLPEHLDSASESIEQGMKAWMRSRMGSEYMTPFIGGTLVTPAERSRILAKMKDDLRGVYDLDAYYKRGAGLRVDEFGQIAMPEAKRREFWRLYDKYGCAAPPMDRTLPVKAAHTRTLHNAMARKLAGQGAWMENTMRSMSGWTRLAWGALAAVDKVPVVNTVGPALFDIEGAKLRLRSPEAAAILDKGVHRLTAASTEITHLVDEYRHANPTATMGESVRHVLEHGLGPDVWKPLDAEENDLVDLMLRPNVPASEYHAARSKAVKLAPEVNRLDEAGVKAWAAERASERRHIARLWVESVAPGKSASEYKRILARVNPDEEMALDKLYHDAFVRPDPSAWGHPDDGLRSTMREWYMGGGKLRYLNDESGLGAALKTFDPKWVGPAEDTTVINFMARLRSEYVKRDVVQELVKHEIGLKPGRTAELAVDILNNPDMGDMRMAATRGYNAIDVIEARRVLDRMGLAPGDGGGFTAMDDVLVAPYIQAKLEEAAKYGQVHDAPVTGISALDEVIFWWKQSNLGRLSILASPARPLADNIGAFMQVYLTRGGQGFTDVAGSVADVGATQIAADLAEMRTRKWDFGSKALAKRGAERGVYVFPGGVYSHKDLVHEFHMRGLDAQAARSENAGQLIDDVRRHDYGTFRRLVAVKDHVQYANEVSNFFDMQWRTRVALGELKRGATMDDACAAAREALYDYSGLQPWERRYGRALFPWYTFTKRNGEAVLKALLNKPGRVTYLTRTMYRQPDLWGFSEEQKERMTPQQWSSLILAQGPGRDMDHDARFYTLSGINPADFLLWVQAHATSAEAWESDLFPWTQHVLDAAAEAKATMGSPEWRDRQNEVPGWMMADPFVATYIRAAFGVERVYLGAKENPDKATTHDDVGRPMRWVAGQAYEQQGDEGKALVARELWRAMWGLFGKGGERLREYGAVYDEAVRPKGQQDEGAMLEMGTGAGSFERLSTDAATEMNRADAIQGMKEAADERFGPKTVQAPGVGMFNQTE